MKTKIAGFFAFIFVLFFCASCAASGKSVNTNIQSEDAKYGFMSATGKLFITIKGEDMSGNCTTVAFAKNGKEYRFFTSAHCVATYDEKTTKVNLKNAYLVIILEKQNGVRKAYPAKLLAIGKMRGLEDFAILAVEIDDDISIMPLSNSDPELGEDVLVVTAPLGANTGFLQLKGYVSKEKVFEGKMYGDKIEGMFLIQVVGLGTGLGTSGGGVYVVKRGEIVGIVTGSNTNSQGHTSLFITPITKFNAFYKEYLEGKHPLPAQR